jgi:hypothetical protein
MPLSLLFALAAISLILAIFLVAAYILAASEEVYDDFIGSESR